MVIRDSLREGWWERRGENRGDSCRFGRYKTFVRLRNDLDIFRSHSDHRTQRPAVAVEFGEFVGVHSVGFITEWLTIVLVSWFNVRSLVNLFTAVADHVGSAMRVGSFPLTCILGSGMEQFEWEPFGSLLMCRSFDPQKQQQQALWYPRLDFLTFNQLVSELEISTSHTCPVQPGISRQDGSDSHSKVSTQPMSRSVPRTIQKPDPRATSQIWNNCVAGVSIHLRRSVAAPYTHSVGFTVSYNDLFTRRHWRP